MKKTNASLLLADELFFAPQALDFGKNQRATYVSIMRVGVELDDELVVKRVDVAGDADKLFGKLYSLTQQGFTVVFSVPHFRARQEMKLELVDRGIPIKESSMCWQSPMTRAKVHLHLHLCPLVLRKTGKRPHLQILLAARASCAVAW